MTKLDRIDRFLKSLEGKGIITADMQSVVFSPEFGMLGGNNVGDADHHCMNSGTGCDGTNQYCTNEDACSSKADNRICVNTNKKSLVCVPANPVCGSGSLDKNPSTKSCT